MTHQIIMIHWSLMGGLLHLVQRGGDWAETASIPITVLLYDVPLLCGFNVAIKGLTCARHDFCEEGA